jgi:hypothetical protein
LFDELRRVDQQTAPPFSTLVDVAVGRASKPQGRRHRLRVAAVISAPIVAAMLLILSKTGPLAPRQPTTVQLFWWQSPTAGLLTPFGQELLSEVPRVGESLPQINTDSDKSNR